MEKAKKTMKRCKLFLFVSWLFSFGSLPAFAQPEQVSATTRSCRQISLEYLGLTYHPEGGNTPQIYPLKMDRKAYLVLDVGLAANLDYFISEHLFFRFTASLYKDCAFVTAGCLHTGPRVECSLGKNRINVGMGPILSFRGDWHRFGEYEDDEFYGDRVYKGWQYRFFPTALEIEYLRKINEKMELQWSLIPGAPLVITSMFGIRFKL